MAALSALQTPPPTPQQATQLRPPSAHSPGKQPDILQKLAVARLKHTVSELEDQVEFDRRHTALPPPKPTTLHLVPDASALTTSITDIKAYVADESAKVTVPLCVLDALDGLKRGSDNENVNARETVRWFDRTIGKGTAEKGVKVQAPEEVYGRWEECLEWYNPLTITAEDGDEIAFTSPLAMTESQMLAQTADGINDLSISPSPPGSPTLISSTAVAAAMPPRILKPASTFHTPGTNITKQPIALPRSATTPLQDPPSPTSSLHAPDVPKRVQPIINCALEILHSEKTEFSKKSEGVFFLVTNNPETSHWAKSFGIPVLNTKELAGKIVEEKRLYKAKKRDWDHLQKAGQPVLDANEFRNRDLRKSPKTTFSQPHGQNNHGGRGGRQGVNQNGGQHGENQQPGRRRNRHNQNSRGGGTGNGGVNSQGNGNAARGGRGGHHGTFGRNSGAGFDKPQTSNIYSTSPTQHQNHQTHHRAPQQILSRGGQDDSEPEYVLGRGANRGVARGKGKLWVP